MDDTLRPTRFVDADSPVVRAYAEAHAGSGDDVSKAVNLYYALRDAVSYDMRAFALDEDRFVASNVLQSKSAFCVPKAVALAALARAVGIPSRIGFADVRNHLATERLLEAVGTDLFAWHGFVELMPDGRWVKATPTFNAKLCAKLGVAPLAFDGADDALLQAFDEGGREFMRYVTPRGAFHDVPAKFLVAEMARLYPALCRPGGLRGRDMEREAAGA